jgi:hypothetical protein
MLITKENTGLHFPPGETMTKMANKKQSLEEKLKVLVNQAKKEWGRAEGGKVNDYIMRSDGYAKLYYGNKNEELCFLDDCAPRVNRGEYIVFNAASIAPEIMRVYSNKLDYQFTYETSSSNNGGAFVDGDGCYRDAPGWGGHSAG